MDRTRITRTALLLLGPALFLLFYAFSLQVQEPDMLRVLGVAAWMVSWWITEAVPIPATSLLPIILFPAIGIFNIASAAVPYADPVIFLFMGGFIIALAMEHNQLHKRIALKLISLTGTRPNGIILGFYLATFILSMWISNTATAVMMLPVALSIIQLMKSQNPFIMEDKGFKNFCLSLLLGIAYAANIGGVMTIIGTPPNVVMVGMMRQFLQVEMGFNQWLLIGVPLGVVMLAIMFILMNYLLFPNRIASLAGSSEMISKQLQDLGPMRKAEKRVSLIVLLTASAWIFRGILNQHLGITFLNDTNIALIGGLLMFMVPADGDGAQKLITWKQMDKLPWGILLLFGGGLSLAKAMESSGLVEQVGTWVSSFDKLNLWVLVIGLTLLSLFLTELMSNVALTTLFIPVVIGISSGLDLPPHLLVIPVTLAASFAFMLPIATPPNAIVFSSGFIRMRDMIRAGILLNLIAVVIICLMTFTLVKWVYGG
ncbi:DASS family sodium-coupled anion symporter [Litoribacter alkaliphilus]|uniref:DASS family sodium-coupled anion symporter n=1 Tax=Litoribacter ruber TaxID=702568 RepID=A0AAP2G4Y2_9BACT|nr:DASS family sodium-coupled anion symporter [Litoribacter alkaliphilus]MBS9524975.1 DASS family sodium-coupled anion symporter [Litoribacter alkaliphilus]